MYPWLAAERSPCCRKASTSRRCEPVGWQECTLGSTGLASWYGRGLEGTATGISFTRYRPQLKGSFCICSAVAGSSRSAPEARFRAVLGQLALEWIYAAVVGRTLPLTRPTLLPPG